MERERVEMQAPSRSHRARAFLTFALVLIGALVTGTRGRASEADARALAKAMFDETRVTFTARLKLSSPGGMVRVLDVYHQQNDDGSATYMEITAPYVLKGTRFLSFDRDEGADEHYTFVPIVRRSVQVPEWTLEHSFLGSTFYMIDIALPDMKEFKYRQVGEDKIDGRECRKVEARSIKKDYPYSKIVYCIAPDISVSVKTEYYDRSDKLLKVWTPRRLEKIDGIWTPLDQEMKNVQTQALSELVIEDITHHAKISPETFTKAYLDR